MPFEMHGHEPLSAVMNVRLTENEKARLKQEADLAGLTVSQLARRRVLGIPVVARTDVMMLNELRRLGGLLKHVDSKSGGAYRRETAEAIAVLKAYMERLSRDC